MRHAYTLILTALLALSCTKGELVLTESRISFSAILPSADGGDTRVSVLGKNASGTKLNLAWQQTDKIQLYSWDAGSPSTTLHDNGAFCVSSIKDANTAVFTGYVLKEALSDTKGIAVLPYAEARKVDLGANHKFYVDIPSEQDGSGGKYLIATAGMKPDMYKDPSVIGAFSICNALVTINVPEKYLSSKIKSVELSIDSKGSLSSSAFLSGDNCYVMSNSTTVLGGKSKSVTVRPSEAYVLGDIYFAVRCLTNANFFPIDFKFKFTTEDGQTQTLSSQVSGDVTIASGKVYDFGTVSKLKFKDPEPVSDPTVTCYTTTGSKAKLMEKTTFQPTSSASGSYVVIPDPSKSFQSIDGFGTSLNWASCYNLMQMSAEDRTAVLKEMFDPKDGLGVSLIRITIGASDYNLTNYTWCDTKGIENFAVHSSDREYVFPVLKEVLEINPKLRIIASPWSAPKWMKRVSVSDPSPYDSWTGGSLNNDYLPDYATYFVKWIRAMEAEGFPIYAVTLQNEPLNAGNSISMLMTWNQQLKFIKEAIGPLFASEGIKTKILVFDHNFDYDGQSYQKDYPINIYNDSVARGYVAGSAWHNYSGTPSGIDNVIAAYPDKEIYFTEASIGEWNYQNFGNRLLDDFNVIYMQMLKRGCKGVTLWSMLLDSDKGPFNPAAGSCKTGYGALMMNKSTKKIYDRTTHYYCIAQTSKVIQQGAVRISADYGSLSEDKVQLYLNPDGSYAAVILNNSYLPGSVSIKAAADKYVNVSVPARSVVSLVFHP